MKVKDVEFDIIRKWSNSTTLKPLEFEGIRGDDITPWTDENGIMYIGLFQFLQKGLQS